MEKRAVKRADPDSRPYFSKIMFPANLFQVRIPPDFKKNIVDEKAEGATLKSRLGTWEVKLLEHEGDTYLTRGWEEFVKHHNLGDVEYLIFKYNGKMCFDVDVFDKSGWNRTYRSASSFTSRYPYFTYTMNTYNIGSKSTLIIPKQFAVEHLRVSKSKVVVLKNPDGVSWLVTIIAPPTGKQPLISKGWKTFADDNSLKKGDNCIFNLVEENIMKVQIYRS